MKELVWKVKLWESNFPGKIASNKIHVLGEIIIVNELNFTLQR